MGRPAMVAAAVKGGSPTWLLQGRPQGTWPRGEERPPKLQLQLQLCSLSGCVARRAISLAGFCSRNGAHTRHLASLVCAALKKMRRVKARRHPPTQRRDALPLSPRLAAGGVGSVARLCHCLCNLGACRRRVAIYCRAGGMLHRVVGRLRGARRRRWEHCLVEPETGCVHLLRFPEWASPGRLLHIPLGAVAATACRLKPVSPSVSARALARSTLHWRFRDCWRKRCHRRCFHEKCDLRCCRRQQPLAKHQRPAGYLCWR